MQDWNQHTGPHAAEELEGEATFRALLESAGQGILGVEGTGKIALVNGMVERLFGYSRQELIGQPVEILIPEQLRAEHKERRAGYFAEPHVRPMGLALDLSARRKDGSEFPVEISLSYVSTRNGVWAISFITDITERKRAEQVLARQTEELARSNSDLQQFAYVVSHDLQEPLRNISGFAELLKKRYKLALDAQGIEFINFILNGTGRMNGMITDLLAYSRVANSETAEPFNTVDLNEVATAAISNLRLSITDTEAGVHRSELPKVSGDQMQLMQVFQNLIGNALKYRSAKRPEITISAERNGDAWIVAVADNGVGIPPRHRERVFGLFKRLHGSDYPGTGVGLAICRKVIERHGGRIWIASGGGGTTVKFTLKKAFGIPD